jgi:hypothetical protein
MRDHLHEIGNRIGHARTSVVVGAHVGALTIESWRSVGMVGTSSPSWVLADPPLATLSW